MSQDPGGRRYGRRGRGRRAGRAPAPADRLAFRELYARHAQATFRFLLHLTGRREAAEDLHQETWLSIAASVDRLAPDSDLAAWIFTIARNKLRSALRRPERAVAVGDAAAAAAAAPPVPADDDPGCRDLSRALASLPEPQREILWLMRVEGLDAAQAAAVLDVQPEAARQRLARARAALAEALAFSAEPARRGAR